MTVWKTVQGSQAVRPEEFDVTTSSVVVYQRRNIERITVENNDGSTTELWQYEEREMGREEYVAMQLGQNRADIARLEPAMTSLCAAATAFVAVATTLTDSQALAVQSLAKTWDQALAEGTKLEYNTILRKDDRLYRVAQSGGVTPQAHQPPDGEGMLAVYRPVNRTHDGTLEDPIPWVYGMDCTTGLYYSYEGGVYLCKGDMIPCVWAPDTPGLWQWDIAQDVA